MSESALSKVIYGEDGRLTGLSLPLLARRFNLVHSFWYGAIQYHNSRSRFKHSDDDDIAGSGLAKKEKRQCRLELPVGVLLE